jgi:hypothetical protein
MPPATVFEKPKLKIYRPITPLKSSKSKEESRNDSSDESSPKDNNQPPQHPNASYAQ